MTSSYHLDHLQYLETEAIHIMREVAAEFERPALLFSGGKDSIVMLALAEKAFWPARIPFPVMHVDTGHNFPEVLEFRDQRVSELQVRLVVAAPALSSASVSLNTSVLYVGQAVGSAIGGLLYAREMLYGAGYVAAGFVALALMTVILTRPRRAIAPAG